MTRSPKLFGFSEWKRTRITSNFYRSCASLKGSRTDVTKTRECRTRLFRLFRGLRPRCGAEFPDFSVWFEFNRVGELLLRCEEPPLMYTDIRGDGFTIDVSWRSATVDAEGSHDRRLTLAEFSQSALDEKNDTSTEAYLFLQQQLRLFGDLCLGRHEINISTITGESVLGKQYPALLTWKECFAVISSPSAKSASDHDPTFHRPRKSSVQINPSTTLGRLLPRSLRMVYVDLVCSSPYMTGCSHVHKVKTATNTPICFCAGGEFVCRHCHQRRPNQERDRRCGEP